MNVYSGLLDLLCPRQGADPPGLLGTLTSHAPVTVSVRGTELREELLVPAGKVFYPEDVGKSYALLPCEGGFLILTEVERG